MYTFLKGQNAMKSKKLLSFLLAVMMIVPMITVILPTTISAATLYPADMSNRYRIKVYWNVVSANSKNDENYFSVRMTKPKDDDDIDLVYTNGDWVTKGHTADEAGDYTYTFESNGFPKSIKYCCCGGAANPSEWYLTKVTIAVIDPVVGTGAETTYWEGKCGLRIATFGGNESNAMWIDFYPDRDDCRWGQWDKGIGSNHTTIFTNYIGWPEVSGNTGIGGPSEIAVPTDGSDASYTFTRGVIYDTLGAKWPLQGSD